MILRISPGIGQRSTATASPPAGQPRCPYRRLHFRASDQICRAGPPRHAGNAWSLGTTVERTHLDVDRHMRSARPFRVRIPLRVARRVLPRKTHSVTPSEHDLISDRLRTDVRELPPGPSPDLGAGTVKQGKSVSGFLAEGAEHAVGPSTMRMSCLESRTGYRETPTESSPGSLRAQRAPREKREGIHGPRTRRIATRRSCPLAPS